MPIIITRDGSAPPVVTNPITPEQRQQLWEAVVRNWCEKNPDRLHALLEPAPAEGA